MTKYDVGILKTGDRVRVKGRDGVVASAHEPKWIDHRTLTFTKELQGADIRFEGERATVYIRAADIEPNAPLERSAVADTLEGVVGNSGSGEA